MKVVGNVSFRPPSTDKDTSFLDLSWDTFIERTEVILQESMLSVMPILLHVVASVAKVNPNTELCVRILLVEYVTGQADLEKKEITLLLLNCTGYAFLNVLNAPKKNMREESVDEDIRTGPLLIAGKIKFKSVESNLLGTVATTIDYIKCVILSIDRDVYEKHNNKMLSTSVCEFQVEYPFVGRG